MHKQDMSNTWHAHVKLLPLPCDLNAQTAYENGEITQDVFDHEY